MNALLQNSMDEKSIILWFHKVRKIFEKYWQNWPLNRFNNELLHEHLRFDSSTKLVN